MGLLSPRAFALAAALGCALVTADAALAGVPTDILKTNIDKVIKVLEEPALKGRVKERRTAVRKIAAEIFDVDETARRSLARHWQARTPAQREEFVQLFGDLLEVTYISKIEQYGGEKIIYLGDSVEGEQATVRTKLITKQGTDIPVDYRMLKKGGDKWMVYDVVIEGVSLVSNYRTQFNKIIQTSSYEELVKKLKTKQEELINVPAKGTS
jgi:phospholipid transport system substrate-binding protein